MTRLDRLARRAISAWIAWRARRALSHLPGWADADRMVAECRRKHWRVSEALQAKQRALHDNMRGA